MGQDDIPKPELGDLTYPKGFNASNLTAVEIEAYCLGYAHCQSETREAVADMVQELIMLRAEVKESRKAAVSTRKRMRSKRMKNRKSYLKDEVRKKATESMVGIKPIKGKTNPKYRVDFIHKGQRFNKTFDDLELAIDYRNEHRFTPKLDDLKTKLSDEQLHVLAQARKIRQSMLDDVAKEDQQRRHGHKRAKAMHGDKNKKSSNTEKDVDEQRNTS